jgi:hypothetical protein
VVAVLLPGVSRLAGSGELAWTMYSRADEFRIDFVTFDAAGTGHRRNPSALAQHAAPSAAMLLAGSEHWRVGPVLHPLRAHLDDLAAYGCRETGASERVELVLHERTSGGQTRETRADRVCSP